MSEPVLIEVADESAVGELRRVGSQLGRTLEVSEETIGRIAVVASELGTNLVKHARGGLVIFSPDEERRSIEILSLDHGPGIADIGAALQDGHSTLGTSGTGLGAISRQSDFFNLYSHRKYGTVLLARFGGGDHSRDVAGVSIPMRGERVNGDGWSSSAMNGTRTVMVVDGLGHGHLAHEAASAACDAFGRSKGSPAERLQMIHEGLRQTRGAAVAVAELDPNGGKMRFAGVGNISATTVDPTARRSAVSLHGIAGHEMRQVREFEYPWSRESSLIMHSDGLTTRWNLDDYPALMAKDPAVIAGVLWNDYRRQNDDATVVVARTP